MSETDPSYSEQHAGDLGAHRATVGTPTEHESVNVPPTRPGAAENARRAAAAREEHETFIPETPVPDERSEAAESLRTEEESLTGARGQEHARGQDYERGQDHEEVDDVRKDIKERRRELGDTVSALAGKADVKARASHAAETAKDKAAHAAGTAKDRAAHAAGTAKDRAAHAAGTAKEKAAHAAGTVKKRAGKVRDSAPAPARKRPMLLIAAAGAVIAFVVRRVMRRGKRK
ncbi:DUF3618 domain-containing protein [Nonomuraea sp. K274]|uniref:DUF3618 domain-containing protein n=1 Tax=Nonomuraea cypriaca TaxID=1187855 RepID=A0A931F1T4_9ACTN|nr:DUF3618 domain-containing protein [Nonomuraea cypriaca]MBF8192214.1 DUF3618 domain-containing protein [Nonomuraea cypriaca]